MQFFKVYKYSFFPWVVWILIYFPYSILPCSSPSQKKKTPKKKLHIKRGVAKLRSYDYNLYRAYIGMKLSIDIGWRADNCFFNTYILTVISYLKGASCIAYTYLYIFPIILFWSSSAFEWWCLTIYIRIKVIYIIAYWLDPICQ